MAMTHKLTPDEIKDVEAVRAKTRDLNKLGELRWRFRVVDEGQSPRDSAIEVRDDRCTPPRSPAPINQPFTPSPPRPHRIINPSSTAPSPHHHPIITPSSPRPHRCSRSASRSSASTARRRSALRRPPTSSTVSARRGPPSYRRRRRWAAVVVEAVLAASLASLPALDPAASGSYHRCA